MMNDQQVHINMRCPVCGCHPPRAKLWVCVSCKHKIDPFILGICLVCEKTINQMECPSCNATTDMIDWRVNDIF